MGFRGAFWWLYKVCAPEMGEGETRVKIRRAGAQRQEKETDVNQEDVIGK